MPDSKKAAVREYSYQVLGIYRIIKIEMEVSKNKYDNKELNLYLEDVFKCYQDQYAEKVKDNILADTVVMHFTRRLGLMNNDLDLFQKEMGEIARNVDNVWLMKHKDTRKKTYLEAYADILMATSLQLTSFGYCSLIY